MNNSCQDLGVKKKKRIGIIYKCMYHYVEFRENSNCFETWKLHARHALPSVVIVN